MRLKSRGWCILSTELNMSSKATRFSWFYKDDVLNTTPLSSFGLPMSCHESCNLFEQETKVLGWMLISCLYWWLFGGFCSGPLISFVFPYFPSTGILFLFMAFWKCLECFLFCHHPFLCTCCQNPLLFSAETKPSLFWTRCTHPRCNTT